MVKYIEDIINEWEEKIKTIIIIMKEDKLP